MTAYEQLARRYCALLGEDPDERVEGLPVWRIALGDLEAAMNALDTYGLDVRKTFHEIYEAGLPVIEARQSVRFPRRVA
ncbi:MAG: hypothetical protein GC155_07040 [Alphaproteobacteria bacterium]|nr:hypothetical protein [Alphaproteobacteria bacterium]